MDRISDTRKCMASLAIFKTLYDEKKDLYSVIASFSQQLICDQKLHGFSLQEFCYKIKEAYGFNLPIAVVKTSLKRLTFLNCEKSFYTYQGTFEELLDEETISSLEKDNEDRNQAIFEALLQHVEKEENVALNEMQKEVLYNSFCSYVIDENSDVEFKNCISSFIISHSGDTVFSEQLNRIRLGVVIFVGLTYNTNYDKIDGIDTKLNIYLETEILFHRAGYNGELFKTLYEDFSKLVTDINQRAQKNLISLYYFSETRREIEDYFAIAEDIVNGQKQLDPSKTAMKYIVDRCESASDVKELEAEFFDDLTENGILLDHQENYYDKANYELNIEHEKFIQDDSVTEDNVLDKLRLLNYINIKRGGKPQNIFRNIGHILLTGNSLTFKLAFDDGIRKEGDVPLATCLDFITNRFWLIADKGMASKMKLTSLDILTKARIVMSASVSESIAQKFKKLVQEDKEGKFNLEKKKAALAGLHIHSIKPEDLHSTNQETYLNFIRAKDIDAYIASNELEKQQAKEKIAQSDGRAAASQELARRVIASYVERENRQRIADHKRELEQYKRRKEEWVNKQMSAKQKKAIISIGIYFIVVAFVCVGSILKLNMPYSILFTLFTALVPFIRSFINHQSILKNIKFLFSKKEWDNIVKDMLGSYSKIETRPKLELMSIEETESKFGKID